jgi:hypothetical protein
MMQFLKPPVISSPLDPNIFLGTSSSDTLYLSTALNMRDQVSHLYKTAGKIVVLSILMFTFIGSRQETAH